MSKFKIRRRSQGEDPPLEINVTPMIDMFSTILAFLLMTAVFSGTGVHVVQVPFLSSAPPPDREQQEDDPHTIGTLLLDEVTATLQLAKSDTSEVYEEKDFETTPEGLKELQVFIYEKRLEEPEFDRITIMTEDETRYKTLMAVFDTLRILDESYETLPGEELDPETAEAMQIVHQSDLIPKIILGNVIL